MGELINIDDLPKEFKRVLTRIYSKRMSVAMIKGVPQSGKTDFALSIAECVRALKLIDEFATNASIVNCDWIKKIEALNILKTWGYSNSKKKLFIYDELIESTTNRRAMSELNVAWVQALPQVSHQSMHIIAIVQEERGGKRFYESVFLDPVFLRGVWYKEQRDIALFKSLFYPEWQDGYRLRGIPKTNVEFDKHTHATFQLNASNANSFESQPLDIQIATLYAQGLGFRKIRAQLGLKADMEVKRALKRVLKGSLQGNINLPIEEEEENSAEDVEKEELVN